MNGNMISKLKIAILETSFPSYMREKCSETHDGTNISHSLFFMKVRKCAEIPDGTYLSQLKKTL